MAHNRKLVLSAVSLTKARVRGDGPVAEEVRDDLEKSLIDSGYLEQAPFRWVGLVLRYGLKNDSEPTYRPIDRKDGELPLAIEIDVHEILSGDKAAMKRAFMRAALTALIHAGRKFGLP